LGDSYGIPSVKISASNPMVYSPQYFVATESVYFKEKCMKRYGLSRKDLCDDNDWGLRMKVKPVNPYFPGK